MPGIHRDELLAVAEAAMGRAYAPYSNYRVGAALLSEDGRVFTGCNVENASYGLTICAERAAVCAAVAAGAQRFRAVAVVASGEPAPAPCGACRQVLAEFVGARTPVWVATAGCPASIRRFTAGGLLPAAFRFSPPRASKKRCGD